MKTLVAGSNGMVSIVPVRGGGVRDWQRWVPYAAVAWSLVYAVLGVYWAMGGGGFPYTPETESDGLSPLLGRFGPDVAWVVVMLAGIPAAALGAAMLRGMRGRVLRPLLITTGVLLAGTLLLLMTALDLLVKLGYFPSIIFRLITGAEVGTYLEGYVQGTTVHQLLCLLGGFLWLAATLSYARLSGDVCLYCGRRDNREGWTSPEHAARWGRTAVYVAMVAPIFYALTRYVWALGFPLGMSEELFRPGQESGAWIGGALFLGNFTLLGAFLMLGLVQRWGEVFPRWMIGLAGRRVPIALAVVPALLASVVLIAGGIGKLSGLGQMAANLAAIGVEGIRLIWEITVQLGPTLLFPVWGIALAVATLGYYYRQRGPCSVCGRGASDEVKEPSSGYKRRHIMFNIFKKQNEMTIIGQGGKIILFTLPSLIAAILVQLYFPQFAALPESISFIEPLGYLLLLPGLMLWGVAVIQLMTGFSKGELVTTGAYGVVRNPIYSSVTFFILPAVALVTLSWVYFVPSVFLFAGVMIFIGEEEQQLTKAFGKDYEDYLARVDRLVPFKRP